MKELIIKNIIHEIINELKSKYPDFKGIYFFGSRAAEIIIKNQIMIGFNFFKKDKRCF